ncbi:MAG: alpha/beta fold hydrolase [bacterium]
MNNIMKITTCFIFILVSACCILYAAQDESGEFLVRYAYKQTLPLNTDEKLVLNEDLFKMYDIYYDSINGERVPATLTVPKKTAPPFPCIIVQHGYGGDREFSKIVTVPLIMSGFATIAIDAEYHGERREKGKDIFSLDLDSDAAALHQTVIDLRRTVDYLQTRADIDPKRIGYIGFSMGGFLGSIFCGVEERMKTCILVVAGGDWRLVVENSQISPAIEMRKYILGNNIPIEQLLGKMAYVDPVNFVGYISPRPVLFLNGRSDTIVPPVSTDALYAAAKEPKKIIWYDRIPGDPTGHIVPPFEVLGESTKWFRKHL